MQDMPPYIPGELTDRIIGFLHDPRTLCNCSLVCRAWLPASRYALFHTIRIRNAAQMGSLADRAETMGPYLAATRIVRLRASGGARSTILTLHAFLSVLHGCFPGLEALRVYAVKISPDTSIRLDPSLLSQFARLKEFYLNDCFVPPLYDLLRIIAALPALERLYLFSISLRFLGNAGEEAPDLAVFERTALRSLHLQWERPGHSIASVAPPARDFVVFDVFLSVLCVTRTPSTIEDVVLMPSPRSHIGE